MNSNTLKLKRKRRIRRHGRVTARMSGTLAVPRLAVFRSLSHIYAQLIDDSSGKTIATASSKELKAKSTKTESAAEVGKLIAEKAQGLKVKAVVFDRGGNKYHGRVKALAEAARAGGLKF